ncbi:MAG: hypothetical protein ACXVCO_01215 [Ktedonobacterales bacterium]
MAARIRTYDLELARAYRLPPTLAALFGMLLIHPSVSPEDIERIDMYTPPKVAIHRLRKRVRRQKVAIHSQRFLGYWLEPHTKKAVLGKLKERHSLWA